MRSLILALSACGAVSQGSECQADDSSLLQARSLVRLRTTKGAVADAQAVLKSLQDVANSLTEGSDITKDENDVQDALATANEALAQLTPAIREQLVLAEQQLNDAAATVQACHSEDGADTRAHLEEQLDQRATAVASCEEDLQAAADAEEEACARAEDCLCDEARQHHTDQGRLCASMTQTWEVSFCEHHYMCEAFAECHESEVEAYNALRADVESELAVLEQEYVAVEQSSCITELIMQAMTPPVTPIPHAALIACDDVDVSVLAIDVPELPPHPEACPRADVNCGAAQPPGPPFHLEPRGSNACSTESVPQEECLEAVQTLGPNSAAALHVGAWAHVPTGCNVHTNTHAYFNTRDGGFNNGPWVPVCVGAMQGTLVAHLEPEGSNACSTSGVSREECLEAVRLFVEEGHDPSVHVGSWAHVPPGCNIHRNNNAYFNTNAGGSNNGEWAPVCNGPRQVDTLIAHIEPRGRNLCSTESVSQAECLEAVRLVGPNSARATFHVGAWAHVPTGCNVHTNNNAYFNTRDGGSNNGPWFPVCSGPETRGTLEAHLEPEGSNACSTEGMSQAACLEAVRLFAPDGYHPTMHTGSWAHVPGGCNKHRNNNAYFNTNAGGSNNGEWTPVCTGPEQVDTLIAHIEPRGRNLCSTESVSEAECLEAVRLVAPAGRSTGAISVASWAHVPPGCVMHNTNFNPYFNRGQGNNNGAWSPVCAGPEATSTVVAHREPEGSNACSTEGVSQSECLEAVRSVWPENLVGGFPSFHLGSWAHVPPGCNIHRNNNAYFNTNAGGSNNGEWSPVCTGQAASSTLAAQLGTLGSNACGTESVSQAECLEAVRLVGANSARATWHVGAWAHVPTGCNVHTNNNAYFNTRAGGNNNGPWTPVCTDSSPEPAYVRGGQDGSCPAGSARVSIEECPQLSGMRLSDGTMSVLSDRHHRVDCAAHFVHGAGCFVNRHSNVYSTAENCPQAQGTGHDHWAICKTAR